MEKTNFEKIKELKNWELALILSMVELHVGTLIPAYPGGTVSEYDHERECLKWLNQPYDDEKGFKFLVSYDSEKGTYEDVYVTLEEMHRIKERNVFKGLLQKNTSCPPLRTLGKYVGDYYLIIKNGQEVEYFAEDGYGYTKNPSEAGIFTLQDVEHFNADIVGASGFLNREKNKHDYLAISVLAFLYHDMYGSDSK